MRTRLLILLVGLMAGWAGNALAQVDERQRVRPIPRVALVEYQPMGLRVGPMQVFPELRLTESYDDNLFRTTTGEVDDFITVVSPSLEVRSNLPAHEVGFIAGGNIGFYADDPAENYQEAWVGTEGRYDLAPVDYLFGGAGFRTGHEQRGSPDDSAGANPGIFRVLSANLGAYNEVTRRFHFRLEGTFDWLDYDDVATSIGVVNNDDRDRLVYEGTLRLGYDLTPGRISEVFVQGAIANRDLVSAVDDLGFDRDSIGYEARAGLALDLTEFGFTEVEIYGGYLARDFDDGRLATASAPTFGLLAGYAASPVTTIQGSAARFIQETTLAGSSGIVQTVFTASVDHLFRRNVAVNA